MAMPDVYQYGHYMPVTCGLCGRSFAGIKQHSHRRGCRDCSVTRAFCDIDKVTIKVEHHGERCAITLHDRALRDEERK